MVHRRNGLLYAADPDSGYSWIFSGDGLLRSAVRDGVKIKRGWNGEVHQVPLQSGDANSIDKLDPSESLPLIEEAHGEAESIFNGFFTTRVPSFDRERYQEANRQFRTVYGTVPILPPDQYRSLLFNVTEGCSFNGCHFCNFYKGTTFQTRSYEAFQGHVEDVLNLFKATLDYFDGVFLGEGDALSASTDDLVRDLNYLVEDSRIPTGSISCFGMGDTAGTKSQSDLEKLRNAGLDRVYLGLESGCGEVVERLNKPFSLDECRRTIRRLKDTGMDLGIIVLLGLKGSSDHRRHPEETVNFLDTLPLDSNDRLFLSPIRKRLKDVSQWDSGIEYIGKDENRQQARFIREKLSQDIPIADYEIDRFLY